MLRNHGLTTTAHLIDRLVPDVNLTGGQGAAGTHGDDKGERAEGGGRGGEYRGKIELGDALRARATYLTRLRDKVRSSSNYAPIVF